jgi:hypothetical protein
MKPRIRNIKTEEVDAHSNELMDEFFEHYAEVCAAAHEKQDINVVFQGWAIQKLSSLQLITIELARCIKVLSTTETANIPLRTRRRRSPS